MTGGPTGSHCLIVPIEVETEGKRTRTYAMLDGGSTKAVVSRRLVEKLQLPTNTRLTLLHTVEGTSHKHREYTKFMVHNLSGDVHLPIDDAMVADRLTMDGDRPPKNAELNGHAYLHGVSFTELEKDDVDVVLSAEFGYTWLGGEVRRSTPDRALALKTPFGWSLLGGKRFQSDRADSCWKMAVETDQSDLGNLINRLFSQDFPNISINRKHLSLDDEHALRQLNETVRFDPEKGHYVCGLPWKTSRKGAMEILNKIDSAGHARSRLLKATNRIKSGKTQMTWDQVQNQMKGIFP